jgi:ferredoxin
MHKVTFTHSLCSFEWNEKAHSLLEFAEHNGLSPPFSCRNGMCGTCISRLVRGTVSYFEEPLIELGHSEILLCCSRPVDSVEIDI